MRRAHHGPAHGGPFLGEDRVEGRRLPSLVHRVLDLLLAQLDHLGCLHASRDGGQTARRDQAPGMDTEQEETQGGPNLVHNDVIFSMMCLMYSSSRMKFKEEQFSNRLDLFWPAKSPDLNPLDVY